MHNDEAEPGTDLSDQEHVKRCLNGNPNDFRFLVERYQRVLFAFLVQRLDGDRSLAEDAAQESLLRAYTALRKLKKPASFHAWLLGIGGRVAHEFQRSSDRFATVSDAPEPAAAVPAVPEEEYHLEEAVGALPETHRRMILLRYYENLSCQEIAERLAMPLGTVTKTLSRAYGELRRILGSQEETETFARTEKRI